MADIQLYELPGCPYCAQVRSKLDEFDLDYEVQEVPAAHGQRTEVEEVSGQTEVPVIVDPDNGVDGMHESADILEYLDETYGQ